MAAGNGHGNNTMKEEPVNTTEHDRRRAKERRR